MDSLLAWHILAALLSGVLSIVAGVIYIKDILSGGDTRPNVVSFFLWTVLQSIALIAQIKIGASWSLVIIAFVTLNTAAVTVLALIGYGYRKYSRLDFFCFAVALGAAYMLWQHPTGAIALAILGDGAAFIPTLVKTYREPETEYLPAWAIVTAASVFGVLAANRLDVANLAFPIYLVISNGSVLAFAYIGRRLRPGI